MNSLFYFPNQKDYESGPKQHSQVYSDHYWQTADGVTLHGWLIPAQREGTLMEEAMGTVLFAHGNAANITTHYWLLSWMPKAGINVFIFDYRGFGQSKGRSTFKGTELDAISALHYLKSLEGIDPDKIIALGQSMIVMLGKNQDSAVKGLIVDGAFYNHQSIANYYLPGALAFLSLKVMVHPIILSP
ncbi:alpha/beta hydrolase [Ignatzschineria rhizosphaerae]|uniref:Alpha/beta hydrolase n=1 Tax=Ignatzschineria rhizosphaerae TaxID=2923279 RepID=A0ABY3X1P5_9GAMM|nr:alpha/beta fold hydrolase [Ignatzschineria rhizosphaerae]UNM95614.1 alpha/beta hydrolase [Ignatzschineria rhizosphaerae]